MVFGNCIVNLLLVTKRERINIQTTVASPQYSGYQMSIIGKIQDSAYLPKQHSIFAVNTRGSHTNCIKVVGRCAICSTTLYAKTRRMLHVTGEGNGVLHVTSKNTNISIEVEAVRIDNVATQILWTRYFLEDQGIT